MLGGICSSKGYVESMIVEIMNGKIRKAKKLRNLRESNGISGHVQRRPLTSPWSVRRDKARRRQKIAFLDDG
nr:hypothetical protein CFP56_74243 [Quercus suber]